MGMFDDLLATPAPRQAAPNAASSQSSGMFDDLLATPAPGQAQQGQDIPSLVNAAAIRYQIDPRMFMSQMQVESNLDPRAVSKAGAQGVGQLMPGTAKDLGVVDPFDPVQNIDGAARYFRQQLDAFDGDYDRALAAYNWGPGNVKKYGLKVLPKETRDYLARVKAGAGAEPVRPQTGQRIPAPTVEDQTREMILGAQYRQGRPAPGTPLAAQINAEAQGFASGLTGAADSAGQLVSAAMPDVIERQLMPGGQTFNENLAAREQRLQAEREQAGLGMSPAWGLGALASPANAVVGPAAAAASSRFAGPIASRVAGSAAAGAVGSQTAPVEGTTAGEVLKNKAIQAGFGAAAGPVVDAAVGGVINTAGRVAGARKGIMASGDAARTVELFKQHGVDYTAGDIDKNRRILRGIEGVLENSRIPGIAINRQPQQIQALEAAKRQLAGEEKRLRTMTFQGLDSVRAAAATEGPRQAEARVVLKMVEEAGDNAKDIVRASGNLKWLRLKLENDELYNEVGRLAGNADVPPTSTMSLVDRYLAKATNPSARPVDYNPETANLLQKWKGGLEVAPDVTPTMDIPPMGAAGQLVDPRGVVLKQTVPEPGIDIEPNTYMRMRDLHSSISKRIKDATQPGGMPADETWLQDIKKAVEKDLEAFEDATPELRKAVEAARSFKRDRVAPFEADALAKALKDSNPDKIWAAFVRQGAEWKGDATQRQLYNALDDRGRAAVRAGIIEDAFQSATTPEAFSPTGFNRMLRQTGYDTFFQGESKRQLEGLMHIMDHINRSDPKKLETWTPMLGGLGVGAAFGAGLPGLATIAAGLATSGAAKWLVSSETGKKLLYSANLYKSGGPKAYAGMEKVMESFRNQFTGAVGRSVGQEADN